MTKLSPAAVNASGTRFGFGSSLLASPIRTAAAAAPDEAAALTEATGVVEEAAAPEAAPAAEEASVTTEAESVAALVASELVAMAITAVAPADENVGGAELPSQGEGGVQHPYWLRSDAEKAEPATPSSLDALLEEQDDAECEAVHGFDAASDGMEAGAAQAVEVAEERGAQAAQAAEGACVGAAEVARAPAETGAAAAGVVGGAPAVDPVPAADPAAGAAPGPVGGGLTAFETAGLGASLQIAPAQVEAAPLPAPKGSVPEAASTAAGAGICGEAGASAAGGAGAGGAVITVGSRMRTLYGDAGIVRYVGETHFKKGEWVGLELDRPKGKNDGEVRGLRYFSCRPLHGLFTKAENLVPDESPPDEPLGVEPLGVEPLGVRRSASRSLDSSPLRAHGDSQQYEAVAALPHGVASGAAARPEGPSGIGAISSFRMGRKAMSVGHGLDFELSPFPSEQIPAGWRQAWLQSLNGPVAAGAVAAGARPAGGLPVQLYVSSVGGDRKTTRDCRAAMDFLVIKKVPHAIHDLSSKPSLRGQLLENAPGDTLVLPRIQLGRGRWFGLPDLQDLEDHAELDPLLSAAILDYAKQL